jgi:hypothetical protein
MMIAMMVVVVEFANSPIYALFDDICTNGITANGNAKLNIT